jgi:uncharacterized protein with HEPN domain
MSKKREKEEIWLKRMILACRKIRAYASAVTKDEFLEEEVDYDGVCMQLVHLGEQVDKMMKDSRGKLFVVDHDHIPWNDIVAQRHKVAHWYEKSKAERIWDVANTNIPALEGDLMEILRARFGTEDPSIEE